MDDKKIERVLDYLSGKLTGAEREAFRKDLESDPELKAEYQFQEALALEMLAEESQKLSSVQATRVVPLQMLVALAVAAGIALLVLIWVLRNPGQPSEQKMFAQASQQVDSWRTYASIFPAQSKGSDEASEDSLRTLLDRRDYKVILKEVPEPHIPEGNFSRLQSTRIAALGISYVQTKQAEKGRELLALLSRKGSSSFLRNWAKKQLVCLALDEQNLEEAKKWASEIIDNQADSDTASITKAKEILEILEDI